MRGADEDEDEDEESALIADPSLKQHARSLRKVLESSDVVIEVLDARDPVGTRCRAVERELKSLDSGRKKLVLVLNKADLVPQQTVQQWLAHLRAQAPTLPFKSSTQQQRAHLSSSGSLPSSAAGSSIKPLMELIKGFRPNNPSDANAPSRVKPSMTIGVIGHPNVGKSSLINTLKRSKACAVAPTPGWTKEVQEIVIEKGIKVLDCPGVVVESRSEPEAALRGMLRVEDVADPRAPVELILARCKRQHLMMLYNIPAFENPTEFLVEVARSKGRLRKGGVPDLDGTARSILRDWTTGKIAYYVPPPAKAAGEVADTPSTTASALVADSDVGSAAIVTQFAPQFNLEELFGEADQAVFGDSAPPTTAKAVRMDGIEIEDDGAAVGFQGEADEMEEDAAMEEDEDDDAEMISVAPRTKKSKSVAFADDAAAVKQRERMFANEVEAPTALNKDMRKAAKKQKKKDSKRARVEMAVEDGDAAMSDDDEVPAAATKKPRSSRIVSSSTMEVEDAPYDFTEFFGANNAAAADSDSD